MIRPQTVPATTAAISPTVMTPQPAFDASSFVIASITLPATMPEKISTEPTDRSMPEVMITNVMPTERISSTAVSMSSSWKLYRVGKLSGASALNTAISASSTSAIQNVFAPIRRLPRGTLPKPASGAS